MHKNPGSPGHNGSHLEDPTSHHKSRVDLELRPRRNAYMNMIRDSHSLASRGRTGRDKPGPGEVEPDEALPEILQGTPI